MPPLKALAVDFFFEIHYAARFFFFFLTTNAVLWSRWVLSCERAWWDI